MTLRRAGGSTQTYSADATTGLSPDATIQTFVNNGGSATFNRTGATEEASTQVVLSDDTDVEVGQPISGAGIPAGTFINGKIGTTINMTNQATATNAAVTITFTRIAVTTKLNDQSGNADDANDPGGVELPIWLGNQVNGGAAIRFDNGNDPEVRALATDEAISFPDGQCTVFAVVRVFGAGAILGENFSAPTDCMEVFANPQGSIALALIDPSNNAADIGGVEETTDIETDFVLLTCAWEFGSYVVRINGVAKTGIPNESGAPPLGEISHRLAIGDDDVSSLPDSPGKFFLTELLVSTDKLSGATISTVEADIAAFYGITLP